MHELVKLKKSGKIKYIGLCHCSAESLQRAYAIAPITCVQFEYSAFTLYIEPPEHKLLETARKLGVAVVAYSPLGRGLLSDTIRTKEQLSKPGEIRGMFPRMQEGNLDKNISLVDKIAEMARKKDATSAQMALAWLLKQGSDIFAIPGTRSARKLKENLGALEIDMSDQEERATRELADKVVGTTSPEMYRENFFLNTPILEV